MRPSALTVAALHLLVLTTWPLAADLDPAIQADLHLVQAEDYITQKNYAAAAEALGKIFALQEQHDLTIPDEFHFKYAQVLHMAGEYEEAVSAVTHYLKIAGRVATHYRDSLSLLHTATQAAERAAEAVAAIAKAEAAAKAEAEARAEAAARARAAAVEVARNIAMVVVPAGSYLMGSPSSEEGRIQQHEGPQHWVTIREAFAVGVYEVTFDEWDACVSAGGCGGYVPDDAGWGRGRRPVIHVSWEDAQRFVAWLRRETGEPYRLLTEAEWEYVARAGSSAARYWGDSSSAQCRYSNGADQSLKRHSSGATVAACDDGYYRTAGDYLLK
ncbi:MAG: formylglycine-generating enzyme family protein [Spirochaetaceae bacterium]|nr:formylglycine-generating enzyme family protein [Spirochaetaceae bacterium]